MKNFEGLTWGSLTEEERELLLKDANAVDGVSGNNVQEDGDWIIDLAHNFSVQGHIVDGEIVVDDSAIIYNPLA